MGEGSNTQDFGDLPLDFFPDLRYLKGSSKITGDSGEHDSFLLIYSRERGSKLTAEERHVFRHGDSLRPRW
jgi:hypothetical protein